MEVGSMKHMSPYNAFQLYIAPPVLSHAIFVLCPQMNPQLGSKKEPRTAEQNPRSALNPTIQSIPSLYSLAKGITQVGLQLFTRLQELQAGSLCK